MKVWTLESAKQNSTQVNISRILKCDAATAFKAFDDQNIQNWFPEISSAHWISNDKEKVGSVRQVNLDIMNVQEHFMIWEANKRFTFYIKKASLPLLSSMIEDCQFKDLGDGTCEFKWDIYVEPKVLSPILSPVVKMIYNRMFGKATDKLVDYVKKM